MKPQESVLQCDPATMLISATRPFVSFLRSPLTISGPSVMHSPLGPLGAYLVDVEVQDVVHVGRQLREQHVPAPAVAEGGEHRGQERHAREHGHPGHRRPLLSAGGGHEQVSPSRASEAT